MNQRSTRERARPAFSLTPHLVTLLAETERLAALLPTAADGSVAERLRCEAAVASMRLDGSPVDDVADAEAALEEALIAGDRAADQEPRSGGTWLDVLARGQPDRVVLGLEYRGVRSALAADDLAERLTHAPEPTLSALHARLTAGLLAAGAAGRLRSSVQAVHDASVGQVIYRVAAPERLRARLALLAAWVRSAGAREHALVRSGVVHQVLLELHPFEAANGRLARAAARLLLRAGGLDPAGAGVPEVVLASDPIGYHREVAATLRRRDLTIWLERWGEAVAAGLRRAARDLDVLTAEIPDRAATFVTGWDQPGFTVVDYREQAGVDPVASRADLAALLDAGRVERVLGARGLRFRIVGHTVD